MTTNLRIFLACSIALCLFGAEAFPCTVFQVEGSPDALVAKNLDWTSGQGLAFVNKRHVLKRAVLVGAEPALSWISQYMSLTFTENGKDFPWEGMNEAGLSVNGLELLSSMVPPAADPRPAIEMTQWMQYILDTSSTVAEAVQNAQKTRVGVTTTVHYFVCDASPRCAVFEYLGGQLTIHQTGLNLPYPALTNNTYDASAAYFAQELRTSTGGAILNSGSSLSLDRYARGALWAGGYPSSGMEQVAYAFSGLRNVAEANTYWSLVFDLRLRRIALVTRSAPQMKWIDLTRFDPGCASPSLVLDINFAQPGNVTANFQDYTPQLNAALAMSNQRLSPQARQIIASYPQTETRCLGP